MTGCTAAGEKSLRFPMVTVGRRRLFSTCFVLIEEAFRAAAKGGADRWLWREDGVRQDHRQYLQCGRCRRCGQDGCRGF